MPVGRMVGWLQELRAGRNEVSLIGADEAAFHGDAGGFGAAAGAEFGEDVIDVALYGAFADEEGGGDFLVGLAAGHQAENFELAGAQLGDFHPFGELGADGGGNIVLAVVDDADALDEIFEARVFEQVGAGAGAEAAVNVFVAFERGEDDDAGGSELLADDFDGFDAVHFRHAEIDERDIGYIFHEEVDGFFSRGGFADDRHIRDAIERGDQAFADDGVIVGDEDANWVSLRNGRLRTSYFALGGGEDAIWCRRRAW